MYIYTYIYIYIYISVFVCVCVCVYIYRRYENPPRINLLGPPVLEARSTEVVEAMEITARFGLTSNNQSICEVIFVESFYNCQRKIMPCSARSVRLPIEPSIPTEPNVFISQDCVQPYQ